MTSDPRSGDGGPRRPVASYQRYEQARATVDQLAARRFPVERLAIVGEGLEYVEEVTGRRGYALAAVQGLVNGGLTGGLVGLLLGSLSGGAAGVLAFWGLLAGALVGLALQLGAQLARGGRADFDSAPSVHAARYVVLADEDAAVAARDELARAMVSGAGR